jgi:hypothetical protein
MYDEVNRTKTQEVFFVPLTPTLNRGWWIRYGASSSGSSLSNNTFLYKVVAFNTFSGSATNFLNQNWKKALLWYLG